MPPQIQMDPGPVTEAGANLDRLAEEATAATRTLFSSSGSAAQGNAGWMSAGALRTCGQAWHGRLDAMIDQTKQAARDLLDSATAVSDLDREAVDRLDDVLDNMAGR